MRRALYGIVVAFYVLAFPYHPALRSPNELCRLWQTRSLVEYGELEINQALRDYGYVGDLSRKDGRFYPSKAPLLSFAAVPLYAVLRAAGGGYRYAVPELWLVYLSRLFLTVLPTLLVLVWIRRFLATYVAPQVADAVTVTYALGSLALSYSLLFMSHQPSAALLFAGFYALWRCARGDWRPRGYLLAGAFSGLAVVAEYTAAMGVAGLALYGLLSVWSGDAGARGRLLRIARRGGLLIAGALPFAVALMAYHQAAFDHPLHSGYQYLNDVAYQPWHVGGFLGIRFPDARAFVLSFFSPLRGLFWLSPFLLLAFPGARGLWRRDRALFGFTAVLFLAYAYFTSSFSYDSWGWTTGPRHLTGLVPFLLLPVALFFEDLRARAAQVAGATLCLASVLVTGLATTVNYIPDSVTNVLSGLVFPLLREGAWPPTVLAALIPNPASGALLLALLVAAGVLVLRMLLGAWPAAGLAVGAGVLLVVLLSLPGGGTPGDRGAVAHLESVWVAPGGERLELGGGRPRR